MKIEERIMHYVAAVTDMPLDMVFIAPYLGEVIPQDQLHAVVDLLSSRPMGQGPHQTGYRPADKTVYAKVQWKGDLRVKIEGPGRHAAGRALYNSLNLGTVSEQRNGFTLVEFMMAEVDPVRGDATVGVLNAMMTITWLDHVEQGGVEPAEVVKVGLDHVEQNIVHEDVSVELLDEKDEK